MSEDAALSQYYTINFEKYLEMIKQIDKLHAVLALLLKEHVTASEIKDWDSTPIADIAAYFATTSEIKEFLDDIINNPSEEEIEIMVKYEIKDVLISISDLNSLNYMFGSLQDFSDALFERHGIATNIQ